MGCLKLEYYERPTKGAIEKIFFLRKVGIEKSAYSKNFCIDYYPGGMQMPGRHASSSNYRYGYNKGSEKDDEISGNGNSYTTHFRQLDVRLNRWWSVDPVTHHSFSPYTTMDNNPIWHNDPLGDDVGYARFGDRVRVGIGRMFNRRIRQDYRKRRDDHDNMFVYDLQRDASPLSSGGDVVGFDNSFMNSNLFRVRYSYSGDDGTCIDCEGFRFYRHNFDMKTQRTLGRSGRGNNGTLPVNRTYQMGSLVDYTYNTYAFPDQLTITDNQNGVLLGGTQDAAGRNVSTVTSAGNFNGTRGSRGTPDAGPINRGWVTRNANNPGTGVIRVVSTTQSPFFDQLEGRSRTNVSKWDLQLHGIRNFSIMLPWRQKNTVHLRPNLYQ